ncbi:glycosyltransferase family 39 protein [Actinoplanes sp. NPDC023801]|uniref:glycosyltransferase family 39 protein n=1 Tax=Actinoplanes sp. NPDC023801 TaxID=3154595 RepID=UPI00340913CF
MPVPRAAYAGPLRHRAPEIVITVPSPARTAVRWLHPLAWIIPPLVTYLLVNWRLTGPSLWADELATWGAVRLDREQLRLLSGTVDAVLTPYYLALGHLTGDGVLDAHALRLPSLIAMTATAAVVALIGRHAGGHLVGLLAGLLFAVLPVTSRYGQEARPYALAMFFAALALLALIGLLDRPTVPRAAAYAAAVAVTGLLHPLSALVMVAGHALAGWRAWRAWPPAALLGAAPAAVLLHHASDQAEQISWISRAGTHTVRLLPEQLFVSPIAGGMVLALAVAGVRRDRTGWALAAAGLAPPALLLTAGAFTEIWVPRYVLVAMPALVVLAVVGAARAGRTHAAAFVALIVFLGNPAQLEIREPDGHGQDSARIAEVIIPRYLPGDAAVFPEGPSSIGWAARDLYVHYLPEPRPGDVLAVTRQRADGNFLAVECPDATCLGDPSRIWIIRTDSAADPVENMSEAKRDRILTGYRTVERWNYKLLNITLMERRPPPKRR